MKNLLNSAARIALAAAIFCGLGLTASAQQVLPHPNVVACNTTNRSIPATNPGGTFPLASNTGTFYFDAGTSGVTSVTWGVKGDLALDGAPFTYLSKPAINVKAVVQGTTTQPGYGKGQVTATYIVGGCAYSRTVTYDVYKTFAASVSPIAGPLCIAPGTAAVVYSVDPIISKFIQHIQQQIGIDTYTWEVKYVDNGAVVPVTYPAGDNSAITVSSPAYTGANAARSFTVDVQVGQCNSLKGSGTGSGRLTVQPALTILEDALGTIACRPLTAASGTSSDLALTAVSGVKYTVSGPGTWTIGYSIGATVINAGSPNVPLVITGTSGAVAINIKVPFTDKGSGDIVVKAEATSGTCLSAQTAIRTLNRSLVAAPASGANVLLGCMTAAGAPTNLTISNAPATALYYWELPYATPVNYTAVLTGATAATLVPGTGSSSANPPQYTTRTPAITVNPPSGVTSYLVKAWLTGCATVTLSKTVLVTSELSCLPTYTDIEPGTVALGTAGVYTLKNNGTLATTCLPSGAGVTYTWEINNTGANNDPLDPWTLAPVTVGVNSNPTIGAVFTTNDGYALSGFYMRVTVANTNTCLRVTYKRPPVLPRPAPLGGGGVKAGVPASARRGQEWLSAYPNPTLDGRLHVDVTMPTGQAIVTITDMAGRELKKLTLKNERSLVDVSNLPVGTYALRAELPSGTVLKQLIQVTK